MRRLLVFVPIVLLLAACGGGETATPTAETVEGGTTTTETQDTTTTEETTTEPTTTEQTTTQTTEEQTTTTPASGGEGDPNAGKAVFASAACGGCHTMAAANASGTIGPSLDESKPDSELVVDRVTNGAGAMPAFKGQLTEKQIKDVAAYVVESTK